MYYNCDIDMVDSPTQTLSTWKKLTLRLGADSG